MTFYTFVLSAALLTSTAVFNVAVAEEPAVPAYVASLNAAQIEGNSAYAAAVIDALIANPDAANAILELVAANNPEAYDAIAAEANTRLTPESAGDILARLQGFIGTVEPAAGPVETDETGSPA